MSSFAIEILNELFDRLYDEGRKIFIAVHNFLNFIKKGNFADVIISAGNFQDTDGRVIICDLSF